MAVIRSGVKLASPFALLDLDDVDAGVLTTTFFGGLTTFGVVLVITRVITLVTGLGVGLKTKVGAGFLTLKKLKPLVADRSTLGFGFAAVEGFAAAVGLAIEPAGFLAGAGATLGLAEVVEDEVVFELIAGLVDAGVFETEVLVEVFALVAVVLLPVIITVLPTTLDE